MEKILGSAPKIILDQKAGTGVVPYLPLDRLNTPAPSPSGVAKPAPQQ
jgi:hypothetical protein